MLNFVLHLEQSVNFMKRFLILTLIIISSLAIYASSTIITSFRALSNGSNISIEWSTINETNIKSFEIQRSSNSSTFKKIKTIDALGKASDYKFIDEEAFMKGGNEDPKIQADKIYTYRIKIIMSNGSEDYSDPISVVNQTNSIRRTWGMIKEMFK